MVKTAACSAVTVKYDAYYAEGPDALGPPTKRLVSFLSKALAANASVLDVGCGQGRDAIWLARAGHSVIGIDPSTVGIGQLTAIALDLKLDVTAQAIDIEGFSTEMSFDCILFDRTLHMIEEAKRIAEFARLLSAIKPDGIVVVLDEAPNLAGLKAVIPSDWAHIWGGKSDFAYRRPKLS